MCCLGWFMGFWGVLGFCGRFLFFFGVVYGVFGVFYGVLGWFTGWSGGAVSLFWVTLCGLEVFLRLPLYPHGSVWCPRVITCSLFGFDPPLFGVPPPKAWRGCPLRLFAVALLEDNSLALGRLLQAFAQRLRLPARTEVVELVSGPCPCP